MMRTNNVQEIVCQITSHNTNLTRFRCLGPNYEVFRRMPSDKSMLFPDILHWLYLSFNWDGLTWNGGYLSSGCLQGYVCFFHKIHSYSNPPPPAFLVGILLFWTSSWVASLLLVLSVVMLISLDWSFSSSSDYQPWGMVVFHLDTAYSSIHLI